MPQDARNDARAQEGASKEAPGQAAGPSPEAPVESLAQSPISPPRSNLLAGAAAVALLAFVAVAGLGGGSPSSSSSTAGASYAERVGDDVGASCMGCEAWRPGPNDWSMVRYMERNGSIPLVKPHSTAELIQLVKSSPWPEAVRADMLSKIQAGHADYGLIGFIDADAEDDDAVVVHSGGWTTGRIVLRHAPLWLPAPQNTEFVMEVISEGRVPPATPGIVLPDGQAVFPRARVGQTVVLRTGRIVP